MLAECFAVRLYAYAVMSNHVHVVLHVEPQAARQWSDEEVAQRWIRLFPACVEGVVDEGLCRAKIQCLQGDPERLAELRHRLGSVSWFMRCLNEPIARQANGEDGCTGRFWEGRFKCQALLDESAVLACMAYVDLNPIRACMAEDLESSEHTSIRRRVEQAKATGVPVDASLLPVAGVILAAVLSVSTLDYLELVDWSGRVVRQSKRGFIEPQVTSVLQRLNLPPSQWQSQMLGIESRYWRAVGTVESLVAKAKDLGQCWLKGAGRERRVTWG